MDVKSELVKNDFRFQKRFGQNFITDKNFLTSIVEKSGVGKDDTVVEIGAGAGTLTAALAAKAKRVIAYEIDKNLEPVLKETLKGLDNVELVFADFLKCGDVSETVGDKYKVIANLPYYVTTPVLFRLIEDTLAPPETISVMVQREVADRLCAKPSTKDYGAITVAVDVRYHAKKLMDVSRSMFYPIPNVDSAVVLMTKREDTGNINYKKLSAVTRAGFAMRRKTLVNNLTAAFGMDRARAEQLLNECGLNPNIRGEALSTADFIRLSSLV